MTKTPPKILIVEDDTALNEAYNTILGSAGYDIKTAFNGEEAIDVTATYEPDIIFLDLRMPVMDGIEFLKAYNKKDKHPKVKIIVFSNYDMQREVDEAYELGAERYVLKALASPNEVIKIVKDLTR
jgi:CheY-like chemotaxis protein